MPKFYQIPKFRQNVKNSMKGILVSQAKRAMPVITSTIIDTKDVVKELGTFERDFTRRRLPMHIRKYRNAIFGTMRDFVHNAVEDLKSGDFYNEDRNTNMYNGIEDMMDDFDVNESEYFNDYDEDTARTSSMFNMYLQSQTSSGREMSRSINDYSVKNTDYMVQTNMTNTTRLMALSTKHHMEQMAHLQNIESIGMSILDFNQNVIADALEKQEAYHQDMLNEMRELKEKIQEQTEITLRRYGQEKSAPTGHILEDLFDEQGRINVKGYIGHVKNNINRSGFGFLKDMWDYFKGYTDHPLQLLSGDIMSFLPQSLSRETGRLDRLVGSIFGTMMMGMSNLASSGKNDIMRNLSNIFGVNMNIRAKPNMSAYRSEEISQDLEQKKAKAIIEVIPQYLSAITESMTGISKQFDYDRGIFVDRRKRRAELDADDRQRKAYMMENTYDSMLDRLYSADLNKEQSNFLGGEIERLLAFITTLNSVYDIGESYEELFRRGLRLQGGKKSYKILQGLMNSLNPADKAAIRTDQLNAKRQMQTYAYDRTKSLISSGDIASYNKFYDDIYDIYNSGYLYGSPNRGGGGNGGGGGYYNGPGNGYTRGYDKKAAEKGKFFDINQFNDRDFDREFTAKITEFEKDIKRMKLKGMKNIDIANYIDRNINAEIIRLLNEGFSKEEVEKKIAKFIDMAAKYKKDNGETDEEILQFRSSHSIEEVNKGINSKFKNNKLVKLYTKFKATGGPAAQFLSGLNENLYELMYGKSEEGGFVKKLGDFADKTTKLTSRILFGEFDENDAQTKEGIFSGEMAKVMRRYLPATLKGSALGGLTGLLFHHPLIGAVAGGALNILTETSKVKTFLWGDPNDPNNKGLFGGIRDRFNDSIDKGLKGLEILNNIDKMVNNDDKATAMNEYNNLMGNNYLARFVARSRYNISAFGKELGLNKLFDTYKSVRTEDSEESHRYDSSYNYEEYRNKIYEGNYDNNDHLGSYVTTAPDVTNAMAGLYTRQLDTIISLLAGGFGFTAGNGKPITPGFTAGNGNQYQSIQSSILRAYTGNYGSSRNVSASSRANTNSSTTNALSASTENSAANLVSDAQQIAQVVEACQSGEISQEEARSEINAICDNSTVVEQSNSLTSHILNQGSTNPANIVDVISHRVNINPKDIANALKARFNLNFGGNRKDKSKRNYKLNTNYKNFIGAITANAAQSSKFFNMPSFQLPKGLSKSQGSMIGMALGGMMLGNPLLGLLAGSAFSNGTKDPNKKVAGTSAKYGLYSSLLGMGPVPGMILGSLFPQDKQGGPKSKLLSNMVNGSQFKGSVLGALLGGLIGGPGGFIVGSQLASSLIDPSAKRPKEKLTKEQKRLKTAKGTLLDSIFGGGKANGLLLGSLAGGLVGGIPGALIGGLGGTIGTTSRNKLNRDKTGGMLAGLGKYKAGLLGAIAGNALLMGTLGPLAPVVGSLLGGAIGMNMGRGKDQAFWKYDENGNRLNSKDTRAKKARFRNYYTHDYDIEAWKSDYEAWKASPDPNKGPAPDKMDPKYMGDKLGFWDSRKKRKTVMDVENANLDAKSKGSDKDGKKFDLSRLEFFNQSKGTGAFKGAAAGLQAFGLPGMMIGGALGAITSGIKKVADGSAKNPFFVREWTKKSKKLKTNDAADPDEAKNASKAKKYTMKSMNFAASAGALDDRKIKQQIQKIQQDPNLTPEEKQQQIQQLTQMLTATNTNNGAGAVDGDGKSKGLMDGLFGAISNFFSGSGGLLRSIAAIGGTILASVLGGKLIGALGLGSAGEKNQYGDTTKSNFWDVAQSGGKGLGMGLGSIFAAKALAKAGLGNTALAQALGGQAFTGLLAGTETARLFGNNAKSYFDQGDVENGLGQRYNQGRSLVKGTQFFLSRGGARLASNTARGLGGFAARSGQYARVVRTMGKEAAANSIQAGFGTRLGAKVINGGVRAAQSVPIQGLVNLIKKAAGAIGRGAEQLAARFGGRAAATGLRSGVETFVRNLAEKIATTGVGRLGAKVAAKVGAATAKVTAAIGTGGLITLGFAVADFTNGFNRVANDLQASTDYEVPTRAKIVNGLIYVIDGLLVGIPSILGIRQWALETLMKLTGCDMDEVKQSKEKASNEYEQFLQENDLSRDAFTMEQYQNATNKTLFGKIFNMTKLDDYKIGGKKNEKARNKYGGYAPVGSEVSSMTTDNIFGTDTSSGSKVERLLSEMNNNIKALSNSAYVVQDNSSIVNISGDVGGGRGIGSHINMTSIRTQSKPETTLYNMRQNKKLNNLVGLAAESTGDFRQNPELVKDSDIHAKNIPVKGANFMNSLGAGVKNLGSRLKDGVVTFASNAWNGAKTLASNVWGGIKTGAKTAASWLKNKGTSAINKVKSLFGGGRGEDPDYYNQLDPRWSNMSFGRYNNTRDTVGDGGCGPATAATVLQKITGRTITPAETSRFALSNGYKLDNGGTTPDYFRAIGSKYGVRMNDTDPISSETLNNLKSGKPVIFLGNDKTGTSPFGSGGGHYIIASGMDKNGNVNVMDPKNRANNRPYNIKDILANSTRSIVSGGRGLWGRDAADRTQWINTVKLVKKAIADNIGHYSQKESHQLTIAGKTIKVRPDCSGFVSACLNIYGVSSDIMNSTQFTNKNALTKMGFTSRPWSGWDDLTEGDIISRVGHVEIFCKNENGTHYVYNVGSNNSASVSTPTATAHKEGYTTVWSPGAPGSNAGNLALGASTAGAAAAASNSTNTASDQGGSLLDKILNNIGGMITGDILSSTTVSANNSSDGSTTSGATTGTVSGKDRSSSFGTTGRVGTVTLPQGLGTARTYMGWQCITSKSSDQYKLRKETGMHFDSEGYAKIGDRYVVAMTNTFGNIGDYVDIYRSDGSVLHAVIGDEKSQKYTAWDHNPANKWGHENGKIVEEFIVDKNTWYKNGKGNHGNPGTKASHPEWGGLSVTKVENLGNYWGRGGRDSSNIFNKEYQRNRYKNPFIAKTVANQNYKPSAQPIHQNRAKASMTPLVNKYSYNPMINIGGRGQGVHPIPTTASVLGALSGKNTNAIMEQIDTTARAIDNSTSSNNYNDNGSINIFKAMLGVLERIAVQAESIQKTIIATAGSSSSNMAVFSSQTKPDVHTYKANMMNSIVAGN